MTKFEVAKEFLKNSETLYNTIAEKMRSVEGDFYAEACKNFFDIAEKIYRYTPSYQGLYYYDSGDYHACTYDLLSKTDSLLDEIYKLQDDYCIFSELIFEDYERLKTLVDKYLYAIQDAYAVYKPLNVDLVKSLFKFVEYANHYITDCYCSDYYTVNDIAEYFIEKYNFIIDDDKIYVDIDEMYKF